MNFLTLINGLRTFVSRVDFIDIANGSFRIRLTGTATADRVVTLPDATGTVLLDTTTVPLSEPRSTTLRLGSGSGVASTSGGSWASIGSGAGNRVTTGSEFVAVGADAGAYAITGSKWTAIGYFTGGYNNHGQNWTAIGAYALNNSISGSNNTAIGFSAGGGIQTGQGNTIIGANIGGLPAALTNNVILGSGDGVIKFQINAAGLATLSSSPAVGDISNNVATTSFVETTTVARVDNLSKVRYLLVIAGESNAGGLAVNSLLTSDQLFAQIHAKIWNNTASVFQPLQVGNNNLLGHAALADSITHGIERGLAREILNTLQWPEAYILKAGQGGSTIAQWSVGNATGYLSTLTTRFNAARTALTTAGFIVRPVFIWFNGINDAIAGTPVATFRTATQAHFTQIRSLMGATTPIFMPQLMSNGAAYTAVNTEIAAIDSADANMWALATVDIPQDPTNTNHYTANGYLRIARTFIDSFRNNLGVPGTFSIGQARTASSNPVVSLKRSTVQSIPSAVTTLIVFNTVEIDTDNIFNAASGTVVISSGAEGAYSVTGMCTVSAGQQVRAGIHVNGILRAQSPLVLAPTDIVFSGEVTRTLRLNAGDSVSLYIHQTNTANAAKDLFINAEFQACLQMTRIGL